MEKEFVPYEQALALKELGFDNICFGYYDLFNNKIVSTFNVNNSNTELKAPLFQQTFRWFREKYSLNHFIDSTRNEGNYKYSIYKREKSESVFPYKWNVQYYSNIDCTTYEEAELECLKKLIEICKNKKN